MSAFFLISATLDPSFCLLLWVSQTLLPPHTLPPPLIPAIWSHLILNGEPARKREGMRWKRVRAAPLCSSTLLLSTPACSFWLFISCQQYFSLSAWVAHAHAASPPFTPTPHPLLPVHFYLTLFHYASPFWHLVWAFDVILKLIPLCKCEIPFFCLLFLPLVFLLYFVSPHSFFMSLLPKLALLAHPPTLMAPVFISVCLYNLHFMNLLFEGYFKLCQCV